MSSKGVGLFHDGTKEASFRTGQNHVQTILDHHGIYLYKTDCNCQELTRGSSEHAAALAAAAAVAEAAAEVEAMATMATSPTLEVPNGLQGLGSKLFEDE